MSRTKSFDHAAVVRAARDVFWRSGYEGTSIPALERATGLSRSSIYNTFGSKRELFDASVQSYLDEVVRPHLRPLVSEPPGPNALLEYLQGLQESLRDGDGMLARNGCLLINAATAPIGQDERMARTIRGYRDELHAAITRDLRTRCPPADRDATPHIAQLITGMVVSALALARVSSADAVCGITSAIDELARHAHELGMLPLRDGMVRHPDPAVRHVAQARQVGTADQSAGSRLSGPNTACAASSIASASRGS